MTINKILNTKNNKKKEEVCAERLPRLTEVMQGDAVTVSRRRSPCTVTHSSTSGGNQRQNQVLPALHLGGPL